MKTNEGKNGYVQPECQAFAVSTSEIICESTKSTSTEQYVVGSTSDWFTK